MKKNFLLLLLMTLLPLAMWAQKPSGVDTEPVLVSSPITWDGTAQALIATDAVTESDYEDSYVGGAHRRGGEWYVDDHAGIQYYVRTVFDDEPVNGNSGYGLDWYPYRPAMHGITDVTKVTATDIGQYQVWYRIMRDYNTGSGYSTSNWVKLGVINIVAPTSSTKPYLTTGPARKNNLVYNDEEQELISMDDVQPCPGWDISAGIRYVVKDTEGMPTAAEEAAATTSIPTKKDAGTYYVYYQLIAGGSFTEDGYWTEVGVGGVTIEPREITEADFEATFATGLVYDGTDLDLVENFVWTGGITRGTVEYIVNDEEPSTGTPTATPTGKDAGDYTLRVVITPDANHIGYTSVVDFGKVNIAKAKFTVSQDPAGYTTLVYNGTEQRLLEKGVSLKFGTVDATTSQYHVDYTMGETVYGLYTEPKAKNAGEYKISYKITSLDPNFEEEVGEGEVTVNIAKADWTLNAYAKIADFTYDGVAHDLLDPEVEATGFIADDVSTITYYVNGEETDVADLNVTDVGEYEVSFKVDGTDNFNEVAKTVIGKVVVSKAKLHMGAHSLEVAYEQAFDYHDLIELSPEEIPAGETLTGNDLKEALVKFVSFDGGEVDGDGKVTKLPQDAGTYSFVLAPIEGNYELVNFIPDGKLIINKIDGVPATVAKAELTYNGAEQELVTVTGTAEGGVMLYWLAEEGQPEPVDANDSKFSEDIPVATPAGDYKVFYVFKGDQNHNDGAVASVDVTIAKAPLAITVDAKSKVYGKEDPKLTYTLDALVGDETEETIGFEISRAEGEDVGEYDITAKVDEEKSKNYEVTITNAKLTITAAALAITVDDQTKVYGEEDPEFTATAEGLVGEETLEDLGIEFSRAEGEDVGTYAITAKVDAEKSKNYTVAITDGELEIEKADLTVTIEDKTKVYEEEDPEFTATAEGLKFEETLTDLGISYSREDGEDVGEYAITAEFTDGDNYTIVVIPGTLTITAQPVTPTAPTANVLTYNGQNQALIKAGSAKGSTVQYALGDGEFGDEIPEAKNAGTYTVKYKFTPGDNFSITDELASGEFNVKILQANVKFRMGKQEETYTGEAFEPKEGKAYTLAAGGFFAGDEDVLTFAFEEGFDATTACEEGRPFTKLVYTFKDDIANYTVDFQNEGLLIIKKADIAAEDFTAPVANELTFNGIAQELVTKGSVAKVDEEAIGTMLYATGETAPTKPEAWTETVPKELHAGNYTVWYKVVGDDNHGDTKPASVAVTINPYTLTADMVKAPNPKPYNKQVQSFNIPLKVTLADKKERQLVDNQDYTVKINDKDVKEVTIKDAGDYVYSFTGKGDYTGTISTTAQITKLELIATAPSAVKTYDATTVIEPEEFTNSTDVERYGGLQISGLLTNDKIDLGGKTISDVVKVPANAINVGEYTLEVDLAAIPAQTNYTIVQGDEKGKLTIKKAAAVKIGFTTVEKTVDAFWPVTEDVTTQFYSKKYGEKDNLKVVPEHLQALEGEFFETPAYIASLLTISREAGEVYKEEGYTVNLALNNTTANPIKDQVAQLKKNYEGITFGTTKFFIEKNENVIKVSIKSDVAVFDGKVHTYGWAEDLSNMVVVGAVRDKKEIFTELPKVTISPDAVNAGDYNITLSGGKSDHYKNIQLVLGSYLTIEPFEITSEMVTIADQQVKVGADANKDIKHDAFTFAEGKVPAAEGVNLYDVFQVVANPSFISGGKIKAGEKPAEGLILAYKSNTNPQNQNYVFDGVYGFLSVTGTPDLLLLDDTKNIATLDRENTDVTFTSRSIRQDDWNVVCLPFDVTIKQISDAFGYAAIDLLKKESTGDMHFYVASSGTVPAGEPFIVKPTSDPELGAKSNFAQVKFTGVTIKAFSANPAPVEDSAGNKFCGTFTPTTFYGPNFWYMNKSEWKQASNFTEANPVKLGAYRAYLEPASAEARIFIEEPDGSITAINGIQFNKAADAEGWYTVNGMKLDAAPTQKGTYIKDGKKVFVK